MMIKLNQLNPRQQDLAREFHNKINIILKTNLLKVLIEWSSNVILKSMITNTSDDIHLYIKYVENDSYNKNIIYNFNMLRLN